MSQISVRDLSFTHDGSAVPVYEHISFQFDTDWKLGFIGRNGRGKTTFLNLLQGKYAYSGSISASGVQFSYFPYPVRDACGSTLEVIRAHCPECQEWEILRELSILQMEGGAVYRPFSTLSNGEQTKALLAAMFLRENQYLLIDEPTNHLDLAARRLVGEYLSRKKGFLLVSHDRAFLDRCVDHVLSINKHGVEVQAGNFSSWQRNAMLQEQYEQGERERLTREVRRLSAAAMQTGGWSDMVEKTKYAARNSGLRVDRGYIGHKSAKMMARSKAIEKRRQDAAEQAKKLLQNFEEQEALKLSPLQFHTARILELRDVSVSYDGHAAVEGVSFAVMQGERVALAGRNGCGKSSILRAILGQDVACSGRIERNRQIKISYVPQHGQDLKGSLDAYLQSCHVDGNLCRAILRKLGFSREQFDLPLERYSAGQKKKVLLARSLSEQAHLYLWDEPLNYIDVISRMQIEQLILTYEPTLLFVEHDAAFCENVATKTVQL